MAYVFFPGCKPKASYKEASFKLAEYISRKLDVEPMSCCRVKYQELTPADTAIIVCNNCAAIFEENANVGNIEFVWSIIDNDNNFKFPDYQGEQITIQDCWIAVEKRYLQDTVRSLLRKMNFQVVEMKENYEKTRFCGVNLLSPCTESNATLAHKRYVEDGSHMFTPMSAEEQAEHFKKYCEQIKTDRVACYCKFCTEAITMGGKRGVHLLELLFANN